MHYRGQALKVWRHLMKSLAFLLFFASSSIMELLGSPLNGMRESYENWHTDRR